MGQTSLAALPPPDQWGENVLIYLKEMSADHHRMLLLDVKKQVLELIGPSIQHGMRHPAFSLLETVSDEYRN